MNLKGRVQKLEANGPATLSPVVRQWLGWPITEDERREIETAPPLDVSTIDTSTYSKELKAWLGID